MRVEDMLKLLELWEVLIAEIETRPGICDIQVWEYMDKSIKEKLWPEVCEAVVTDWSNLSPEERNEKEMSKKLQWKLTENGVLALYEQHFKKEVRVQVIFKTHIESTCYLRVSDGQHLSPLVLILNEHVRTKFSVGAIIIIKERQLVPFDEYVDEPQWFMNDYGMHHLYIENYTLLANHTDVPQVLGSLRDKSDYRDNMKTVLSVLTTWIPEDEQLTWEFSSNESLLRQQEERDRLREQGNTFFKQNDFNRAIDFYNVAKVEDPYDCRVWSNCSHAYFKLKDYLLAEVHAIVAMKLNPFYEKAYYRAGQAAIKQRHWWEGEEYAKCGIFICGETKELRQILDDAARIPLNDSGILGSLISDSIDGYVRDQAKTFIHSALESLDLKPNNPKSRGIVREIQEQISKKKHSELRGAFVKEHKKETKKPNKKNKKSGEDMAATAAGATASAAATSTTSAGSKEQKSKGEEEKKHVQDKKEEKNKKSVINIEETLQEGQRLYQSEQFHKAIEMYSKCLASNGLTDTRATVKLSEPYNVQVVQLVIGVCKVQSTRGYIFEGLEIMQTLLGPSSKFSHKPACRYWLAVSFEKICCFKLSQKHAQLCKDALKKSKNIKPIKWPATEQLINWTRCDVLETECNLLLEKLSSSRPSPKAKCRYKNCITTQGIPYAKDEIYLTDPDFKGYLNVICEEDCTVSYHPCCWKAFKEQHDGSVNRMSDKDFLGELCVTPDCTGKISSIQIYDDEGRMKNELAKDKKDRKHMAAPVKQKKKKDKKKEKPQSHKKRTRVESVCEDLATNDDTSPTAAESSSIQNAHTNSNNNSSSNNNDKHKSSQKPQLPIDPESLEKAQVTILKPGAETEEVSPTKSTKKNKKKKVKKPVNQPNLLGDPLEADLCVQSEYIARLRMLRQQRDALEAGECPNLIKPINVTTDTQKPVVLLDPDNPFYLPQHLRDNPEELERVLQEKLTTSSPPGLQQETINTLLDFMYDWLKAEGPMRTSDPRLAEQVAENFPQEARDYVIQCRGITGLLMQSLKFAMIDNIVCVHDDVMKAQEMMCQEVMEKMNQSKYLVRYSDGQKAKRFTHLLDDTKSTCSTTSSSSQRAVSVAESTMSRDSAGTRRHTSRSRNDDPNNNDDSETIASLAPLSKTIVDQFHKFADGVLNPAAPEFEPHISNSEVKSEDDDDDDDDEEEEDEEEDDEGNGQYKRKLFDSEDNRGQWNKGDTEYIENWAAQAGEKAAMMLTDEDEDVELGEDEEEEKEVEEVEEEDEEREAVPEGGEEERIESIQDEEYFEATEEYISQLLEEKEKLADNLQNEQEQNQVLSDKLYQVKSQYKSEVMKLKEQLEELKDQNKELTTEKNAITLQKEAEAKKFKADQSRMNEETKATGSRLQSIERKIERMIDHNNELQAKLVEETELNTQLKEELEKMKNLQESLTSCSRRAREAEVKYLSTKKDLVDANMTETISRLTEEATAMRQLLPGAMEDSALDRTTLARSIVAWDEAIKNLCEQQRIFREEGVRLLGMIHQGRPLSALPVGDLAVPSIPTLSVAPLLSRFQKNHHRPSPTFAVPEVLSMDLPRHSSPGPQGPPLLSGTTQPQPQPPMADLSCKVPLIPNPPAFLLPGPFNGHPLLMQNGGLPPNHASGAIPKGATSAPPGIQHPKTAEMPCQTQPTESPGQLFVGQLPWDYSEADVKNLFSQFGEVVSVNIFDKGCNADGRPVPKYGFITFRNVDDCNKALSARPIYVRNHMLNVQAKEAKKPTKPASVPAAGGGGGVVGGGAGVGGAGGGGGLTGIINELDATNGTKLSAYGLTGITVEANKSAALHHHTLPTSPTLHHHQPPPPPTSQSVTKPKFQKLLPTNNTVGGIVAPPPKLVRPQPKTVPNASKLGGQASASKEEMVMPSKPSYTRLIEICKQHFGKEFSSPDICIALKVVRAQNNNSLSGLNTEKIVERVRQHLRSRRPSAGAATVAPWAGLTQGVGVKTEPEWQGPSKEEVVKEEQCSICLEPLNTSPNQTLACFHTFHALCINDWIKIQSNCPNCRKFALMPDEYPTLSHN
ncbi:uncharacterized protein LOC123503264 isoform X3 [Portunus trituberculatus]|uniref:uncharacterized protein LOC123503264 isoform X3 n=1 Tax=Portunus trituberculatus TaxID=210409 RepID=UPI001E1D0987|nr:uncharacterized protein LOC123503264 isoform X3 [Portunus trituberculatus]